ncbi:MAG: FAD-dependent oxidoreductase [Aquificaceae bacterium]|nr:FAD-dependent oxidoreductase [Aquificaceae bacterium]
MKIAVIGSGMAGNALVEELIKSGSSLEVHLFGEEKSPPYNRIYLSEVLSGMKLPSQLYLKSYQQFEEEGVKLHLGERVERIFPHKRSLLTSKGELFEYHKLVIATGSKPLLPPIKGIDKKKVFPFRTIEDVYRIMEMERVSNRAVVIGGGLLGVECAKALRDVGLEVYLVHLFEVLMEKQLDKTAGHMLKKRLEDMGIRVLLGKNTEEILGEREVKGVRFSDGESLEADFVVMATGVKPNVELAINSGLLVRRGILVNDYLETSAQEVYAVGECIEHRGRTFGLLAPVLEQVRVCAKNLLQGNVEKYESSLEYAVLKVAGVKLMSAGDVWEKEEDEVVLYRDRENYRKAVIREGKLVGFILYGNLAGSQKMLELLKSGEPPKDGSFLIKDVVVEEERELKEADTVCNCGAVSYGDLIKAISGGAKTLEDIQKVTRASTYCGSCAGLVESILRRHVKERPKKVNKVEAYKKEKHPFERDFMKKLEEWAKEGDWQRVPEEDREMGLKWYGVFYRKATPGYFMVRIRITHGRLTSEQAKVIAHLAKTFGRGEVDLTSRQQIQLRWIELKDLPKVLSAIERVGLTTLQTGMDNVRNVTGDPLSGLVEDSLIDTTGIARRITELFLQKKRYADLPRKFNLALLGSKTDSINCKFNDLCFYLAKREGILGFNVYAGGKIGSGGPQEGFDLDLFVKPYEAIDLSKAVLELYSDMGSREDRSKNRLYFLIKELGVEGFRSELERRLLRNFWRKGEELVERVGERQGLIRQKKGLFTVSLVVPAGIFAGEELEELAELARKCGSGEIRLSVYQNLYLVNVPEENLSELLSHPLFEKYQISASPYFQGLMACQGSKTCAFGVIENKPDALRLATYLSDKLPTDRPIRMHWSGCAKGCGQHGAGDLGFVGTKIKVNGQPKLAVEVFVGGRKVDTVPLEGLEHYVEKLVKEVLL